MYSRAGRTLVALIGCVVLAACSEPPTKEMDLARQAVEAARAAHADRYAAAELKAAEDALDKSTAAVAGHDFKLALNHALTSHERAQAATRLAADAEQALRRQVTEALTDATARLATARREVGAALKIRTSRKAAAAAGTVLNTVDRDLQKARAALDAGDLEPASRQVQAATGRIIEAIGSLQPARRSAAAVKRPAGRAR